MKERDELIKANRYVEESLILIIGGILSAILGFVALGWLFLGELAPRGTFIVLSTLLIMIIGLTGLTFQGRKRMKILLKKIENDDS